MVKCYLGITGSLCTEVADAVCAVADAFLGEFKERLGYDSVDIGACVDRNGVEPAEGFETGGEDVDLDIGADAVLVVEFVESLGDADAGVGEEDSLAVEVVYYARQVQVAAYGDVEVAELVSCAPAQRAAAIKPPNANVRIMLFIFIMA